MAQDAVGSLVTSQHDSWRHQGIHGAASVLLLHSAGLCVLHHCCLACSHEDGLIPVSALTAVVASALGSAYVQMLNAQWMRSWAAGDRASLDSGDTLGPGVTALDGFGALGQDAEEGSLGAADALMTDGVRAAEER